MNDTLSLTMPVKSLPQADAAKIASQLKNSKDTNTAKETATNFEALYMNEMMSYMFQGIETDGPFGGGNGEDIFRSLMIEQYSNKIASSGQTKIGSSLEKEMLKMQELQQNPNKPLHTGDIHAR
jgi:Rod binding domain-containing protein